MKSLIGYMRMSPSHEGNKYHMEIPPLEDHNFVMIDMNGMSFPNKDLNRLIVLSVTDDNVVSNKIPFYLRVMGFEDNE